MRARDSAPTKVAVIGGGCAALSAAFELTRPELEGRFAVTVHQLGFRLGGKGASGRGKNGRIEEHGLHLWMGYYENAFRLMRDCYAELGESGAYPLRFEDAFAPADFVAAMDWSPRGAWLAWKADFPRMPGLPGDPDPPRLGVADYLARAARLLGALLSTLPVEGGARPIGAWFSGQAPTPDELVAFVGRLGRYGAVAGLGVLIEALHWIGVVVEGIATYPQSLAASLLDLATELLRKNLGGITEGDDETRRLWEVGELILASLRGAVRFRLAFDPRGFDAIDDYDCREWLRLNGASEGAINSAFIRALYDLAFAYEEGDPARPAIAAGSALRGAFRAFFGYRGAFFWRMNAGMGDIVFAPLYLALKARGVRFEFFHKLTSIGLSPREDAEPHVATLAFDVQARARHGRYEPLIDVDGLPCWPAEPDYAQLAGGKALANAGIDFESQWDTHAEGRRILRVGEDFDFAVLGVGLGVVPHVCGELLERDVRWRELVEHVKSVPTQAFQLWLDRDREELGWPDRAVNLSGFVEPFDTWADMTHLVPRERWKHAPKTLAYFCNALADGAPAGEGAEAARDFVRDAHARVREHCVAFLNGDAGRLWPAAQNPAGEFRWEWLATGEAKTAPRASEARFDTQFWTANVRPSDRYSQALPGSTRYRISPLDRSYDNFTVAGDWTNSSLNMGCVEGAVMSGLLAAHALSGFPKLSQIVGYDHP
ncbi:MAG TPA: FAD-dependent oxidoreductase [Polyangiaceae bacterium]|nr:FAD-dependent oxidoreductase [Polyangiaceae bacterium]